jgi:hypothetical protein
MQKLGSPISNLISRTILFGSTTSSLNAKSKYPVFQKTHDEMIKTKQFYDQIKLPLVKLTMRPNNKRLNDPRSIVRSNAFQRHIDIDTRWYFGYVYGCTPKKDEIQSITQWENKKGLKFKTRESEKWNLGVYSSKFNFGLKFFLYFVFYYFIFSCILYTILFL